MARLINQRCPEYRVWAFMPSIGGIPVGVQIMNTKEDAMSKTVKPPSEVQDTFLEVLEGLEHLKKEIEWILENADRDGTKPFSKRHKEIIRGSTLNLLRDRCEEGLFMFCFGDVEYGVDSINNLLNTMQRYGRILS